MWDQYEQQVNNHFISKKQLSNQKVKLPMMPPPNEKLKQLMQTIKVDHNRPTISSVYFQNDSSSEMVENKNEYETK